MSLIDNFNNILKDQKETLITELSKRDEIIAEKDIEIKYLKNEINNLRDQVKKLRQQEIDDEKTIIKLQKELNEYERKK